MALAISGLGVAAAAAGPATAAPAVSTATSRARTFQVWPGRRLGRRAGPHPEQQGHGHRQEHRDRARDGHVHRRPVRGEQSGRRQGAAADRTVGQAPTDLKVKPDPVEKEHVFNKSRANGIARPLEDADPLDGLLWGHEMVNAFEARALETGDKVRVGILDTGVDGDHLDIAPNFDAALSLLRAGRSGPSTGPASSRMPRSATTTTTGATHVAGTIGAALGVGMSGSAPRRQPRRHPRRPGQRRFFLGPVVNALTYAGNDGLDVVNMSFYVDPWLYNCQGGAPEDQKYPEAVWSRTSSSTR